MRESEKIIELEDNVVSIGEESSVICPICKKNDELAKVSEQHVMFQMFIAKPVDDYVANRVFAYKQKHNKQKNRASL